jgi:hypothetical protein
MSDTPLTHAAVKAADGYYQPLYPDAKEKNKPVHAVFAAHLEQRLAAVTKERDEWKYIANRALDSVKDFAVENRQIAQALQESITRIKRLEEAGDALHDAVWSALDWGGTHVGDCSNKWTQAKEAR